MRAKPWRWVPHWMRDRRTMSYIGLGAVAVALYAVLVPLQVSLYSANVPVTMLLGALAVGAPLIAVRRPTLAIALFTASAVLIPLMVTREHAVTAPWPWSVAMIIAFVVCLVVVTIAHGWRRGLALFVLGNAAGVLPVAMLPSVSSGNVLIVTGAVSAAFLLVSVLLAGRLRLGQELSSQRALTAAEQARRELVEERTRIARELHDVVAHSMSLIQVQASTARYRVPDLPAPAAAEFDDIAATARTSLTEMRRILGVLRTEDQSAELAPQRGVDDIPALVESTRRAGATITLVHDVSNDIDPATQIAAYRIVQEALSNAVRHAAGAQIAVSVTTDAADLRIRVRNEPSDRAPGAPGGHGLRGMSERAQLLGGNVEAHADSDGGWSVVARLPQHPPAEPMEATR
ncbi:sensor histidine kinase [Microbacterium protaetiae]|uniref:histidine kinase n=2 Tax=Microbacterium protaetiae TaxID=2509458 RepID=A0A4V0YDQ4_9MICO|nr:sensor histidine kinase [Microbacterium protaetiae]